MNYEKAIATWDWRWDSSKVGPLASWLPSKQFGLRIESIDGSSNLRFTVTKGKECVYSWQGHRFSAFRIVGSKLIFVDSSPSSSGGKVCVVDLLEGKELWREDLHAIGPVQHSAYSNLIILEVRDDVVTVWGKESMGRYIEVKDLKTGKTVGHKVFPPE